MGIVRRCAIFASGIALCFAQGACKPSANAPATDAGYWMAFDQRIPAFGGELVGSDHGEFGGELAFRARDGKFTPLLETNVVGLHETPLGFVAVTGLAHMSHNEGEILSISRTGEDRLTVDRVVALPFAPLISRQRSDGSIEMKLFTGDFTEEHAVAHACMLLLNDRTLQDIDCPEDWRKPLSWDSYSFMMADAHGSPASS